MRLTSFKPAALVASCITVAALAACSSSASPGTSSTGGGAGGGSKPKIAMTVGLANDPYWITMACGAKQAVEAAGGTLTYKGTPNSTDATATSKNVSALLLNKPDGFLYSYDGQSDETNARSVVNAKVPLVELNYKTNATGYLQAYYSASTADDLAKMGQLIAKNAGDSGSVAILAGQSANPVIDSRWKPLLPSIKAAASSMTILDTQYDGFDTSKASSQAAALLVAHPDLKAIYTTSGPEGAGAASAVQSAGKAGKVLVYSFDATPAVVSALRSGTIAALLAQPAYQIGQHGAAALMAHLKGGASASAPSQTEVTLPTLIVTKDNVDAATTKNYLYQSSCS